MSQQWGFVTTTYHREPPSQVCDNRKAIEVLPRGAYENFTPSLRTLRYSLDDFLKERGKKHNILTEEKFRSSQTGKICHNSRGELAPPPRGNPDPLLLRMPARS